MPHRLAVPETDPAAIFELFRGNYASELLTAAVVEFRVFARLAERALSADELRRELGLAERPATVLLTALRAMKLIVEVDGRLRLTTLAQEHLVPGAPLDVSAYLGLAAESPGVLGMIERLKSNHAVQAARDDQGTAFTFRQGVDSAMDQEASARRLTLALAGRARNVAPALAEAWPLSTARRLLDVGGGSGLYTIAWLERHRQLRGVVWDRAEVLKVAIEMDRLECVAGDMFADPVPEGADVCLLSNVLHDWDVADCRKLVTRCAAALAPGGWLLVHDVLLNDALDGPLPIALYSAALFSVTEGRAYSAAEYRAWLTAAGLQVDSITPTLAHCSVIAARKPG
jgi:SAM-dependent methyltransferase